MCSLHSELVASFRAFANDEKGMSSSCFLRCLKTANLFDDRFRAADADLIFASCKPLGKRRIDLATFHDALRQVSSCKRMVLSCVLAMVSSARPTVRKEPLVRRSKSPRRLHCMFGSRSSIVIAAQKHVRSNLVKFQPQRSSGRDIEISKISKNRSQLKNGTNSARLPAEILPVSCCNERRWPLDGHIFIDPEVIVRQAQQKQPWEQSTLQGRQSCALGRRCGQDRRHAMGRRPNAC